MLRASISIAPAASSSVRARLVGGGSTSTGVIFVGRFYLERCLAVGVGHCNLHWKLEVCGTWNPTWNWNLELFLCALARVFLCLV